MVTNVHVRDLHTSFSLAGTLLDSLSSKDDKLWPYDRWSPMKFDRPLGIGAVGGHGMIRYVVEEYRTGHFVSFRFTEPQGFIGTHAFDLQEFSPGVVRIRHVIRMKLKGAARIWWPLVIRWLHDALIEDAFDKAEAYISSQAIKQGTLSLRVRLLRRLFKRRRTRR